MNRLSVFLVLLFLLPMPAVAGEIRGEVTHVEENGKVIVRVDENQSVIAGDPVRIIWNVGGEALEVRFGTVAADAHGKVTVSLSPGESVVSPSMIAIIQSSASLSKATAREESKNAPPVLRPIDTRSMEGSHTRTLSPADKAREANMFFELGESAYNDERWEDAMRFHKKASVSGHIKSPGYVGYLTSQGLGEEKKPQEAMRWFLLGEERGDPFSISEVGEGYEHGKYGLAKNEHAAFERHQRAADLGWAKAMRKTGWFLQNGIGTSSDMVKALAYYREAADLGNRLACNDVGWFYRKGLGGLEVDQDQANYWFGQAAEKGLGLAMYNLGESYRLGLGFNKDRAQAESWYRKAIQTGNEQAESWAKEGLELLDAN